MSFQIQKLPQVCTVANDEQSSQKAPNKVETSDMRIAFRYNALPLIDTNQKSSASYFDSSKKIDREMLANSDIELFKETDETITNQNEDLFRNPVYGRILMDLKKKLNNSKFSTDEASSQSDTGKNLLRISISSLGSPLWYNDAFAEDLCLFLFLLKALVRTSIAVGCITVPSHLFKFLVRIYLSFSNMCNSLVKFYRTTV